MFECKRCWTCKHAKEIDNCNKDIVTYLEDFVYCKKDKTHCNKMYCCYKWEENNNKNKITSPTKFNEDLWKSWELKEK